MSRQRGPGARSSRYRWSLLAAALALLGLGVVAALVFWPSSSGGAAPSGAPGGSAPPATLSEQDATALSKQLVSSDPAVVARALAAQARAGYLAKPGPIVPPGDTLAIDPSTFTRGSGGPGYGTAHATATGPHAGKFLVFLVYENSAWRVAATVQQP